MKAGPVLNGNSDASSQRSEVEAVNSYILRKWLMVAAASFLGAVIVRILKREPFSGIILMDLASLIGLAFIPFAAAMLVAVFIKGKPGIVIGLSIVVVIVGLMILGAILPAPGPGALEFPARIKESTR